MNSAVFFHTAEFRQRGSKNLRIFENGAAFPAPFSISPYVL
jgi:hypothetical protein